MPRGEVKKLFEANLSQRIKFPHELLNELPGEAFTLKAFFECPLAPVYDPEQSGYLEGYPGKVEEEEERKGAEELHSSSLFSSVGGFFPV